MNNYPSLTVLIPAYNNTESLKRALVSLKNQTVAKKLNILISDDCSPSPIIKSEILTFKDSFSQLLFFRQDLNLGVLSNPTWLFNQIKTEYFAVFQHDDILIRKNFYEDVLQKFASNEKLVCYFGNSILLRINENTNLDIYKESQNRKLMYNFNSTKIKGIKKDGSISGEDFIDNIVNQYDDFNTAWSAIVFNTNSVRNFGGFGGYYCLSWFEAKSLGVYREEEFFGCLYLLCLQGNIQLEAKPSVIRCLAPTSYSESPTHPVRKMRQDGEIYALFKIAWIAERFFNGENIEKIIMSIYKKCSTLPLREETRHSNIFFKTYFPHNSKFKKAAYSALDSSRKLKSPYEFYFKVKGYLRYYRNIFREKFKNKF